MSRLVGIVRAHRVFALLFAAGALLRCLAMAGYHPALLLSRDANVYLRDAHSLSISGLRPALYPIFLKPAVAVHDLALVVGAQHVMGLGMALAVYALVRRLGLGPTVGALSAAPVLLDGYQIAIEHFVLSETLFETLAVAGCVILLWPRRGAAGTAPGAAAEAGFLLGLAFLTRYVGAALVVAALVYLLLRERGLRRRLTGGAALLGCFMLPLAAYSLLVQAPSGTNKIGYPLYGRVATFTVCRGHDVPAANRELCPTTLPRDDDKHLTIWFSESPLAEMGGTRDPHVDEALRDFALWAISRRPGDYLASVGWDLARYFSPAPPPLLDSKVSLWLFPRTLDDARPLHRQVERLNGAPPTGLGFHEPFDIVPPLAAGLRYYQLVVYTWGPLLAAAILLGLLGARLARRAVGNQAALGSAGLLFSLAILGLLLARVTLGVYGYRYMIVTVPFVGPAVALGATVLAAHWPLVRPFRRSGD